MPRRGENELIRRIERTFAGARDARLRLGIGDDAALWRPTAGRELVLTCDWFLEGSHFLRDKHPADAVGWKSLARATSDIAAMGGRPRCFLLSLALPGTHTGAWLDDFLKGLRRAARVLGCTLAGGDTTRREEFLVQITVIGESTGHALQRGGGRAGDLLYVSGRLGEAELGLRELRRGKGFAKPRNAALRKHLYPQPRIELGAWLAEKRLATAAMDVSDGLSTDLPRLCAASGVGAEIVAEDLPAVSHVSSGEGMALALHGGDDYELLFAVRAANARRIPRRFKGLPLTRIGRLTKDRKLVVCRGGSREVLTSGGWDPFRG